MHRGEVYLADFGMSHGHVQSGIRPVVIIQNETGNKYSPTVIVAPLTSRSKKPIPTHCVTYATGLRSTVLTECIKTLDKSWLGRRLGQLTLHEMEALDRALAISIGLS